MEYFAVLIIAWIIQLIIIYFWKKDKIIFYKEKDDKEQKKETNILKKSEVVSFLWILFFFILTAVSCSYLYYYNIDKLNFCKLVLVYFMILSSTLYDWKEHKIPNKILSVCLSVRCFLILIEFFYHRSIIKAVLISCVGGTILIVIILLLLVMLTKQGFGIGDVKLFSTICFTIGLMPVYNLFFYSILYTAVCSVFLLLIKKVDKRYKIPFAPFIFMGYLTIIFFQLY